MSVNFPDGGVAGSWPGHGHGHGLQDPRQLYFDNPRPLHGGIADPPTPPGSGAEGPPGVNLAAFKLQLPTGNSGRPDTVTAGALGAYNSDLFQRNGRAAITFTVPEGGGATTAHSRFPGTELAEAQTWKMTDGTSRMGGEERQGLSHRRHGLCERDVHRSFIIKLRQLQAVERTKSNGYAVRLLCGRRIPVGPSGHERLLGAL